MKYDFKKIEKKWQKLWCKTGLYEPDLNKAKNPFYNLMMFPYPSAEGLHVGNMYAFTGSDIYGRYKRMQGYDVFEPIGLDGFGIHSENYALKIGKHPADQAKISEKNFYRQLKEIGNGFAWREKLETYDPRYYRWTQWLFIQMFKHGLAYRKKQAVNWCPSCKTVLADEQVIAGKCERCGKEVVKKELEQWFFRITKYAEKLLDNLDNLPNRQAGIDWSERVKIAQRNWIGKSEGALLKFPISNSRFSINIFTTRPDTLFGVTYMVLAAEHELIEALVDKIENIQEVKKYVEKIKNLAEAERIAKGKEKTGVELKGIKAVNPATGKEIPVWIADYVLTGYGTSAIMAVPAHDQRDFDFAKKYNLPIKMVICPNYPEPKCPVLDKAYEAEGHLVDSGKFTGMTVEEAKKAITKFVGGELRVQYRLRDWLISRQRYWGPPIPMIYCPACAKATPGKENSGWVPAPEKDLPIELPKIKDFRPTGTGKSPLASAKSFYETKCPNCGGQAKRETDVSDTFFDSVWYYLRYPSLGSRTADKAPWDKEITKKWLPVNMYIGGAEHAVLHLLYSRFIAMALHDMGFVDFEEPFTVFRAHGLLISEGAKMSKSKGNIVNPDEYIKNFGADTLRMYLMFLAPFEMGGDFRDQAIMGVARFLERVWRFCSKKQKVASKMANSKNLAVLHQTIKKITEDIEKLHYNTAISALMILLNVLEKGANDEDKKTFLKLLAPFAPHISEELWHQMGGKNSIHKENWPEYDSKLIKEENFELLIQINGKLRNKVVVRRGVGQAEVEKLVLAQEKVKKWIGTNKVQKIIFVPDRLINIIF